jgi:hypothetical protein
MSSAGEEWVMVDNPTSLKRKRDTTSPGSQSTLWGRLKLAYQSQNPPLLEVDQKDIAGRKGEDDVIKCAVDAMRSVWLPPTSFLMTNLRVKDGQRNCEREIDVLLLSPHQISVIEVKNWSGQLKQGQTEHSWHQVRRNGQLLVHNNALEETESKAVALRECLLSLLRDRASTELISRIETFPIQSLVLLVNDNLKVDPNLLSSGIVCPREWQGFIQERVLCKEERGAPNAGFVQAIAAWVTARVASRGLFSGSFDLMSDKVELSSTEISIVSEALQMLPTWDVLVLEGGKKLFGDFLYGKDRSCLMLLGMVCSHLLFHSPGRRCMPAKRCARTQTSRKTRTRWWWWRQGRWRRQ